MRSRCTYACVKLNCFENCWLNVAFTYMHACTHTDTDTDRDTHILSLAVLSRIDIVSYPWIDWNKAQNVPLLRKGKDYILKCLLNCSQEFSLYCILGHVQLYKHSHMHVYYTHTHTHTHTLFCVFPYSLFDFIHNIIKQKQFNTNILT